MDKKITEEQMQAVAELAYPYEHNELINKATSKQLLHEIETARTAFKKGIQFYEKHLSTLSEVKTEPDGGVWEYEVVSRFFSDCTNQDHCSEIEPPEVVVSPHKVLSFFKQYCHSPQPIQKEVSDEEFITRKQVTLESLLMVLQNNFGWDWTTMPDEKKITKDLLYNIVSIFNSNLLIPLDRTLPSPQVKQEDDIVKKLKSLISTTPSNWLFEVKERQMELLNPWTRYNWSDLESRPKEHGRYEVYRAGAKKQHYETWNGSGWASDNNDITHYRKIISPHE